MLGTLIGARVAEAACRVRSPCVARGESRAQRAHVRVHAAVLSQQTSVRQRPARRRGAACWDACGQRVVARGVCTGRLLSPSAFCVARAIARRQAKGRPQGFALRGALFEGGLDHNVCLQSMTTPGAMGGRCEHSAATLRSTIVAAARALSKVACKASRAVRGAMMRRRRGSARAVRASRPLPARWHRCRGVRGAFPARAPRLPRGPRARSVTLPASDRVARQRKPLRRLRGAAWRAPRGTRAWPLRAFSRERLRLPRTPARRRCVSLPSAQPPLARPSRCRTRSPRARLTARWTG